MIVVQVLSHYTQRLPLCCQVTNPLVTYCTTMCLKVHNNILQQHILQHILHNFDLFLVELKIGMQLTSVVENIHTNFVFFMPPPV